MVSGPNRFKGNENSMVQKGVHGQKVTFDKVLGINRGPDPDKQAPISLDDLHRHTKVFDGITVQYRVNKDYRTNAPPETPKWIVPSPTTNERLRHIESCRMNALRRVREGRAFPENPSAKFVGQNAPAPTEYAPKPPVNLKLGERSNSLMISSEDRARGLAHQCAQLESTIYDLQKRIRACSESLGHQYPQTVRVLNDLQDRLAQLDKNAIYLNPGSNVHLTMHNVKDRQTPRQPTKLAPYGAKDRQDYPLEEKHVAFRPPDTTPLSPRLPSAASLGDTADSHNVGPEPCEMTNCGNFYRPGVYRLLCRYWAHIAIVFVAVTFLFINLWLKPHILEQDKIFKEIIAGLNEKDGVFYYIPLRWPSEPGVTRRTWLETQIARIANVGCGITRRHAGAPPR